MTEHPILFSAPMVRAILEGGKTQTRRAMKPQPAHAQTLRDGRHETSHDGGFDQDVHYIQCPYGVPGDRLWVREMHALVPTSAYRCSDGVQQTINPRDKDEAAIYREGWERSCGGLRWRPSIHMPRWASRITLEVTGVRVELLHDISEEDALSEAAKFCSHGVEHDGRHYRCGFSSLWDSINAQRAPWMSNPLVWVIDFRRAA